MRLFPASRPERLVFEVEAWRSTSQFACVSQPGPLRANRYRRFSRPCGIDVVLLIAIGNAGGVQLKDVETIFSSSYSGAVVSFDMQ